MKQGDISSGGKSIHARKIHLRKQNSGEFRSLDRVQINVNEELNSKKQYQEVTPTGLGKFNVQGVHETYSYCDEYFDSNSSKGCILSDDDNELSHNERR